VVNKLFDQESLTTHNVKSFLRANRDNLPPSFLEEQVLTYVRDSVRVEILQVIVPSTKVLTPVYNVYIYPPTRVPDRLAKWRKWITRQDFFAGDYGVGRRYEYTFSH